MGIAVFSMPPLSNSDLVQQGLDIGLPHDLAFFAQNRGQDLVGGERIGQDAAQHGDLSVVAGCVQPGTRDKGPAGLTLVFLHKQADLIQQGVDPGLFLRLRGYEGFLDSCRAVAVGEDVQLRFAGQLEIGVLPDQLGKGLRPLDTQVDQQFVAFTADDRQAGMDQQRLAGA